MNDNLRDKVDTGLEAAAVAVPMLLPLLYTRDRILARLRSDGRCDDAGFGVVEWVLITAIVITIVLSVGALIRSKLEAKTNQIDFTTPG